MALVTKYWTWITHFCIWGSLIFYFIALLIYCKWDAMFPEVSEVAYVQLSSGSEWMLLLVIPVLALTPDMIFAYLQRVYYPKDWQLLQERQRHCIDVDSGCWRSCMCSAEMEDGKKTLLLSSRPPIA
eukprot:Rmarinus@m.19245